MPDESAWKPVDESTWKPVEEPTITAQPKTWADKLGITNPVYRKELDTLEGAASGAARTLSNIAEATYRGATSQSGGVPTGREVPPAGVITAIPAIKSARTTPPTFEGNLGRGLEQIGEYALPASKLGTLSKAANLGTMMRAGAQGTGAAAVAGAQSGMDPLSMIVAGSLGAGGEVAIPAVKQYVAEHMAPWLYQTALKPRIGSDRVALSDVKDEIGQALKKGIAVSESGYSKAKNTIADLMNEVKQRLVELGDNGERVQPQNVVKVLDEMSAAPKSVNPEAAESAIAGSRAEYLRQHTEQIPYTPIRPGIAEEEGRFVGEPTKTYPVIREQTPVAAQEEKMATYRELGNTAYGELKTPATEAKKALARGIKTDIERIFPEVKGMNKEEGTTIDLADDIAHRLKMAGNREIAVFTPYHTLARAIEMPEVKSNLAILLHKAGISEASSAARLRLLRSGASAGISNLRSEEPQNVGNMMQGVGQ